MMDHPLIGYVKDLPSFHRNNIFLSSRRRSYEMHWTLSNLQLMLIIMSRMYLSTSIIRWYHLIRSMRFFMYMDWRDINEVYQSLQYTVVSQWESRAKIVDDKVRKVYDSVLLNYHKVSFLNHWNESVVSSWFSSQFHDTCMFKYLPI
jgi:hypothetical protein